MKLVILDGHALNPGDLSYDVFKEFGTLEYYERTPANLTAERMRDADIVFLNKVQITKEILLQCPKLKYIGVFATGYNVIDTAAARERGITVTNIPSYSTMAVAQATFALLLELTNGVHAHNDSVKNGGWIKSPDFCYWTHPLTELLGKTFGVVGFGSIGQAVAKIANALGMKVIAHSRTAKKIEDFGKENFTVESVSLDELLQRSDIVSLHCPLTADNKGMINQAALAKMKDGAILLNTARGPLIDEAAVRAALESKKLFAFGADVLSQEPMSADCPLLGAPNCVITPHVAWAAKETRERLLGIAVDNLRKFLAGTPVNVVN